MTIQIKVGDYQVDWQQLPSDVRGVTIDRDGTVSMHFGEAYPGEVEWLSVETQESGYGIEVIGIMGDGGEPHPQIRIQVEVVNWRETWQQRPSKEKNDART